MFEDGGLSHEYYNLIVTGDGDFRAFSEGSIVMSKDRVLTEMMVDDVRERFGKLTPEVKKEILNQCLIII